MDIPSTLIIAFPPSRNLLLDRVRRIIDDSLLTEIARADYGQHAKEMFALLRPIRDTGVLPDYFEHQLSEVLELSRYHNPDRPDPPPFTPGPTGVRGHLMRLFACAVLLRKPESDIGLDSTLAFALTSARLVGEGTSDACGRLFTWHLSQSLNEIDRSLLAFCLLIVAIRLRAQHFTELSLHEITEWVLAEEAEWRASFYSNPLDPPPTMFSVQQGFWQPLIDEISTTAEIMSLESLSTNLKMCAILLA